MTRKISVGSDPHEDDVTDWVKDDSHGRSTPCTEEERDRLVEGVEGIRDTAAWKHLVHRVGKEEARRALPSNNRTHMRVRTLFVLVALAASALSAQEQGPTAKPFAVSAHRYAFDPPRIEVNQDDLVKIELRTDDIAHSLTIDEYRIAKRVGPGQPVTFEFRADRTGTFPYYCNLQVEDGCRQMRGVLVVKPRR